MLAKIEETEFKADYDKADAALKSRVDQTLAWLVEDGAAVSEALVALLVGLESEGPAILVVDIV